MHHNVLPYVILLVLGACSGLPLLDNETDSTADGDQEKRPTVNLTINGINDLASENIRAHVSMSRSPCTVPEELLKRRLNKTESEANNALQALGYYEARISTGLITDKECPELVIDVEPGRRMNVSEFNLTIEGQAANDKMFMSRINDLPLKEKEPLNHADYSKTKSRIESVAAELGYLEGRFERATLQIDMANYTAKAIFNYKSGERYLLGDIMINQSPRVLRDTFLRRLIESPAGEPYSSRQIVRIQDRLSNSGYFKDVEVRPRLEESDGRTIPVTINVTPSDRHKFYASLGFSSDEGIRSRLGYTNRWWNDRGHRLGGEIRLSQIEQGFTANYQIPRKHPSNEWLRFTAGLRQEDVDTFQTKEARISVTESKRRPWGFLENRYIALSRDDFDIGGEQRIGTFLIPGLRWNRRTVDNDLYPLRGLDISFELRGGAESLVSDTSFARSNVHVHYLRGIGYGLRVSTRGTLGALWVDDFNALPPSERFFAGGDNSIRGYDFQELGPVNDQGLVIGGRYLGVFSFELEKRLFDKWGVASFIDTGNAFGGPGSNTGFKIGAGVGLRWLSPVGPVRVDVAHPFDDDDDTVIRFHFRIGTDI